jgi:Sporulation related domain.
METPPSDYESLIPVYLVEEPNEAGETAQVGGFFDRAEAEKLKARLAAEGRAAHINVVPIHRRWEDYEVDR